MNNLLVKISVPCHGSKGKSLLGLCHYTVYIYKPFDYKFFYSYEFFNYNVFPR